MNKFVSFAKNFAAAEEGVTMIEYGLIAALVALVCIVAVTAAGQSLKTLWERIALELATAAG